MSRSKLTLVRIGEARLLTRAEVQGPYAEIGVMRSRTPL